MTVEKPKNPIDTFKESATKLKKTVSRMVITQTQNAKPRKDGVVKVRLTNDIDQLRVAHHKLNKANLVIKKENAENNREVEEAYERLRGGEDKVVALKEQYEQAKLAYEEELDRRQEEKHAIAEKEEKIKMNNESIRENNARKVEILAKRKEVSEEIHNRMESALMTNPGNITKALRKEILDLMFEENSPDLFEELKDEETGEDILRFGIKDDKETHFYIDVKNKEEGMVIHSKQGQKGKMRLVAITKGNENRVALVDPKTLSQNEKIDELAKNIMMTIIDQKVNGTQKESV